MNTTTPASNTPLPAAPEQKISPEALAATLLWHLLLLLIFAFLFKFQLPTKNEEGGVALNFGFENETGFGNEQPFIDMPVANAQLNITAADIAANQQMPAAQTNTTITENPMQNEELLNSNEPEAPVLPSATPQPSKTKPATENQPNEDQPANNNSNTPPTIPTRRVVQQTTPTIMPRQIPNWRPARFSSQKRAKKRVRRAIHLAKPAMKAAQWEIVIFPAQAQTATA
ncbi:MAG: hypothetical protein IPI59_14795 [Sphingobacteriales bacterium]|nr:hypothetical protein [Sphingobacteriales bacterium]